jgi:hypothetical protein
VRPTTSCSPVADEARVGDDLTGHVLRHTFGTRLVRGGRDLVLVAELKGHARIDTPAATTGRRRPARRRPDPAGPETANPKRGQLLEALKVDPQLGRIPVIMLTGTTAASDVRHAYQHHANAFVTKPVDPDSSATGWGPSAASGSTKRACGNAPPGGVG